MKSVKCPSCGAKMKRNGKTSAGGQRWRCPGCGASTTVRRDGDAAALREFLGWLMSKGSQREMPGQGRSFRRRTAGFWADFLEDTSVVDGRRVFTHESLRRARSSLSRLVSEGTLFTYLDPELTEAGPLRSTDNAAESLNARLRDMLRNHRGMSLMRRVKAVFWWCHMHSGDARTSRGEAGDHADRRGHRLPLPHVLRLPEARGRRPGVGRQGRVGGAPPQGPVPLVARLPDGNTRSIGTHFLSYNPEVTIVLS